MGALDFKQFEKGNLLVLASHPDDEAIGLGVLLQRISTKRVHVLYLCTGVNRHHPNATDYTALRQQEAVNAMALLGIPKERLHFLNCVNRELAQHLPEATEVVGSFIRKLAPRNVFAPAYEGGHPDHDATAALVLQLHNTHFFGACNVFEYTLYNVQNDMGRLGGFLPCTLSHYKEYLYQPTKKELVFKQRLLDVFDSQKGGIVDHFPVPYEMIRPAFQVPITGDKPTDPTFGEAYMHFNSHWVNACYSAIGKFLRR